MTTLSEKFISFKNTLKRTLFPKDFTCDICSRETFGGNLCSECIKKVTFNTAVTCPICGRKTVRPEICIDCKDKPPKYKKGTSALVYDGGSVVLIHKFKNGSPYLKDYFCDLIEEKVTSLPPFDYITYIPLTEKAERIRGYNQSKLLAKTLSERIKIKTLKCLIKTHDTPEQKHLNAKERESNLEGCFRTVNKEKFKGKTLLLVDDVLTTGATANTATQKLLSSGATCVYFASVASVEYKQNLGEKTAENI
jgi:competence protein ComFC